MLFLCCILIWVKRLLLLSRARWLTCPDPDAEELFRMVGEVFIFWSKSHVSVSSSRQLSSCSRGFLSFSPLFWRMFFFFLLMSYPARFSPCSSTELQERRAELCGDERDQQHVLPHRWQQEQDEQGESGQADTAYGQIIRNIVLHYWIRCFKYLTPYVNL